ncbi:MAG: DUF664 domain-containing protein [Acidobacteria bacterium]|nr:MAG: DUF664 domain-containing protein [Acidobacteriota bacterium]
MSIAESILPEFDHETATTRALLERVPEAHAAWKPHDKSMSLGELAMHIATIPVWASITLERKEFDRNPPDGQRPAVPHFESSRQLLQTYDGNVAAARALVVRASDGEFMVQWTLKNDGKSLYSLPRVAVFRSFVLNHAVHHRGQLTVYLRLLDVPIPNIYGPTADT